MIKLFHIKGSLPCFKVQLMMAECALNYESIPVDLWSGQHRENDFKNLYPAMKLPVIDIDGFVLGESNAILRYVAARFERYEYYPLNLEDRAQVDQWMDYASMHICENFGVLIWQRYWMPRLKRSVDERQIQKAEEALLRSLAVAEDQLSRNSFLAGNFLSLADLTLFSHVCLWSRTGLQESSYPQIMGWAQKLANRPRWQDLVQAERSWPS